MKIIPYLFLILLFVSCTTTKNNVNNVNDTIYQYSEEYKQYRQRYKLINIKLSVRKTDNNILIATLDFINNSDEEIGIPYWYFGKLKTIYGFIDELINNLFIIKNENNQIMEYNGKMVSTLLVDREDVFIIKPGEDYIANIILNNYYKISNDYKKLEVSYETDTLGNSNVVIVE